MWTGLMEKWLNIFFAQILSIYFCFYLALWHPAHAQTSGKHSSILDAPLAQQKLVVASVSGSPMVNVIVMP